MKKIIITTLVFIILTVLIFSTSAYYTDSIASAGNRIEAGVMDIQLREMRINGDSGMVEPYTGPVSVMPGVRVSKIVTAYNAGDLPAYIRIRVDQRFELAQGVAEAAQPNMIGWELNVANWVERDGYYYYRTPLAPGAETEPLFTQVTFTSRMDDRYEGSLAYVKVTMDAVQSNENGADVFAAAGWPAHGEEGSHE